MILLALIGCIFIGTYIAESDTVYFIKWQLAKYKIWYLKENKHLPIGTQIKQLKPFDCKHCLAFWLSLFCMYFDNYNIFVSFACAIFIYKLSIFFNK